jgi:hypothetical protein
MAGWLAGFHEVCVRASLKQYACPRNRENSGAVHGLHLDIFSQLFCFDVYIVQNVLRHL